MTDTRTRQKRRPAIKPGGVFLREVSGAPETQNRGAKTFTLRASASLRETWVTSSKLQTDP